MKKMFLAFICILPSLLAGCASTPPVSGLISLEAAVAGAAASIEKQAQEGNAAVVAKINSPLQTLSDFIISGLENRLNVAGKLAVLTRGESLKSVTMEQEFQMSGMVSDETAVGVGHYLGAQVVITGDFSRFANFSQLTIRAVEVETARLLATYTAKIAPGDPVLAGITAPLGSAKAQAVSEAVLEYLNLGKDYLAAGIPDIAIEEFDHALAKNRNFAEAWFYRGQAHEEKALQIARKKDWDQWEKEYDLAMVDYTKAIRLDPNNAVFYDARGEIYRDIYEDYDRALADFTRAIRLDTNNAKFYESRMFLYQAKEDYRRAITEITQAIRLNPIDHYYYYDYRAALYHEIGNYDRAIADYTEAIRLAPNDSFIFLDRASVYQDIGDYDRAIADSTEAIRLSNPDDRFMQFQFRASLYSAIGDYDRVIADATEAIRLCPDEFIDTHINVNAYTDRGTAYYNKKDYARARADYEKALQLIPDDETARSKLNELKKSGH